MHGQPTTGNRVTVPLRDFLRQLFDLHVHGDSPRSVHLASFPGSPRDKEVTQWGGFRWAYRRGGEWTERAELPADCNQYFSVGLMRPDTVGRSDKLVYANPLIALDDVGTKVPIQHVRELLTNRGLVPTAVVETSPGNHSLYYKIADRLDLERGDRVRAALCGLGLSDPSVHDRSRYMRLPYGVNAKRQPWWGVRLLHWRPGMAPGSYDQWEDAIGTAGGSLTAVHVPVVGDRAASLDDPWVQLAGAVGLDPRETRPGVVEADCPFTDEHTDNDPSGFAFVNWGRCHCHHGHCQDRRTPQFLERIAEMYREQSGRRAEDFLAQQAWTLAPTPDSNFQHDEPRKLK